MQAQAASPSGCGAGDFANTGVSPQLFALLQALPSGVAPALPDELLRNRLSGLEGAQADAQAATATTKRYEEEVHAAIGALEAQATLLEELATMQEAAAAQQTALEQLSPEQQSAIQDAMSAASEAQLVQQCQFYSQLRAHEAERIAKSGGYFANTPARFKDGYRPLRLCKHFNAVGCWREGECTYAHSLDELHPASPDLPRDQVTLGIASLAEMGKVADTAPDVRLKKKKEICRKFLSKDCILGRACPYAHGEHELGTIELVVCGRVKTRICKFWAAGNCMFIGNCVNAHGEAELGTKRPEFITPPMKKRKDGESLDEFRQQVIAKPAGNVGSGSGNH